MLRAHKFRIYPNKSQQKQMAKTFGCVRFVWNKNVEAFRNKGEFKTSTEYRQEFEFLKEVSAAAVQQKELDFKEYKSQKFSKTRKIKIGKPKFKSRKKKQSFRLPNQKFKIIGNKIQLEKIGRVPIVIDKMFDGRTISVTISKDLCGDYFASILVEEVILPLPKTGKSVGVDVGLKALITTSDGLQVQRLRDNQAKLKRCQKMMSRKKKGSRRWNDLRLRVARLHRDIARRRSWLLHNVSRHLVENYDVICVEDLNVVGMMKNHKLAAAIADASWSELIRQLDYKCKWYGKELVKIDRWSPSSKTCNACGKKKAALNLAERTFVCGHCNYKNDRDVNAALNIKAVGVTAALQTVMGCKTYFSGKPLKQALSGDLLSFL